MVSAVANIVITVSRAVVVDGDAQMALPLGEDPLRGIYPASLLTDRRAH